MPCARPSLQQQQRERAKSSLSTKCKALNRPNELIRHRVGSLVFVDTIFLAGIALCRARQRAQSLLLYNYSLFRLRCLSLRAHIHLL